MKTFAEFQAIGHVGRVVPAGSTLKVSIAADYGRKNDKGEWEAKPHWNTVTRPCCAKPAWDSHR